MADLTPDDIAALRVRLADLPGFDATGLFLRDAEGAEVGIVVYDDGRDVLVHEDDDSEAQYWTKDQDSKPYTKGDEEPHASAADSASRDRLARWCAERVGVSAASIAPAFAHLSDGTWLVLAFKPHRRGTHLEGYKRYFRGTPSNNMGGKILVPALAALDPDDPRLLPDGSRWVEAVALVAVAKHMGGRTP